MINILLIIPHFVKGKSQYRVVRLERGNGELLAESLKHVFGFNVFSIATNIFMIVCNEMIAQTLGKESLTLFAKALQQGEITALVYYVEINSIYEKLQRHIDLHCQSVKLLAELHKAEL